MKRSRYLYMALIVLLCVAAVFSVRSCVLSSPTPVAKKATPGIVVSATPGNTPTVALSPTATATPSPTATSTPQPTATPAPHIVPTPTPQPVVPTPTPQLPTPTPTPTPQPPSPGGASALATVESFYQAVQAQNYATAYSLYLDPNATVGGQRVTQNGFVQMAKGKDASFGKVTDSSALADTSDPSLIILTSTRAQGLRYHSHAQCKLEGKQWKIVNLDIL